MSPKNYYFYLCYIFKKTKFYAITVKEADKKAAPIPKTIVQATNLSTNQIEKLIKETIAGRPNRSCMEKDVVSLILTRLEIITRGKPRQEFKKKINKQIDQLVSVGILQRYNGKTGTRIRILV